MRTILRSTLILFGLLTLVTGVVYPLFVTIFAQIVFPHQANGSMLFVHGRAAGSELIGQSFDDPKYFWGRPSATGGMPYNAAASSGSNLAPSNPVLMAGAGVRMRLFTPGESPSSGPVPIDLIAASGSGLDPHISIAAARYQIGRVAQARHVDEKVIESLIARYTASRQWGFLGEGRVNVLKINLALDEIQ